MRGRRVDKVFLITVFTLVIFGVVMFVSASLGILNKNKELFFSVLFSQLALGLGCGLVAMYLSMKIDYKFWRRYAFLIFLGSILLTAAVFIPGVGWGHQGAERWIKLGPISFQPVEFLKFGFIIYFAAWLSWAKNRVQNIKFGVIPFAVLLAIISLVLFKQPDTKSFILIAVTGMSMLFISGVSFRYILGVGGLAIIVLIILVATKPYLQARVKTFLDPSRDPRGSSYQIQQSLITFGSGGIFGRGFGQSIQKFGYLPEPQGDSIFAVLGEELGFVGTALTILLFTVFALRGLRIANHSPDLFSRLLVSGIVILISVQAFMHIASISGVFPLTGVPLPFMSHGGTSLMIYLGAMGVVFQISRLQGVKT